MVKANEKLLRLAMMNLANNCIRYSDNKKARFLLYLSDEKLHLDVINSGPLISDTEKQFLFQHFFRGENSTGKRGFGLGLVLINKIILLHGDQISYSAKENNNIFTIVFFN